MSSIDEIRAELRYLVRELGLLDKSCFGSGLSLTQAHLLTYLSRNGPTSFYELNLQLNIDKASLSRMLTILTEKNYVETLSMSKDKRQKHFRLTASGKERLSGANSAADKEMAFIDEEMEGEDVDAVINGLRILRKGVFRRNCIRERERIQVERARECDNADVHHLLLQTFSHEQTIPEALIALPEHYKSQWWVARSGEYLLGAVACWQENNQCHWGRFAVDPAYRGLGIGKQLAYLSLKESVAENNEIMIEARDTTVRIISQLGGEIIGEAFDFYGMPVTPMRLTTQAFENRHSVNAEQP